MKKRKVNANILINIEWFIALIWLIGIFSTTVLGMEPLFQLIKPRPVARPWLPAFLFALCLFLVSHGFMLILNAFFIPMCPDCGLIPRFRKGKPTGRRRKAGMAMVGVNSPDLLICPKCGREWKASPFMEGTDSESESRVDTTST